MLLKYDRRTARRSTLVLGAAMALRTYYLDEPLTGEDKEFVSDELSDDGEVDQRRIPHVLPVLTGATMSEATFRKHRNLLRQALRNAGIGEDSGRQVAIVAPTELYWYSVLTVAVYEETGAYPFMVQTSRQRGRIGNPGGTRILDGHAFMMDLGTGGA